MNTKSLPSLKKFLHGLLVVRETSSNHWYSSNFGACGGGQSRGGIWAYALSFNLEYFPLIMQLDLLSWFYNPAIVLVGTWYEWVVDQIILSLRIGLVRYYTAGRDKCCTDVRSMKVPKFFEALKKFWEVFLTLQRTSEFWSECAVNVHRIDIVVGIF